MSPNLLLSLSKQPFFFLSLFLRYPSFLLLLPFCLLIHRSTLLSVCLLFVFIIQIIIYGFWLFFALGDWESIWERWVNDLNAGSLNLLLTRKGKEKEENNTRKGRWSEVMRMKIRKNADSDWQIVDERNNSIKRNSELIRGKTESEVRESKKSWRRDQCRRIYKKRSMSKTIIIITARHVANFELLRPVEAVELAVQPNAQRATWPMQQEQLELQERWKAMQHT